MNSGPQSETTTHRDQLEELDGALVVLARSAGALRLALGDGLARLKTSDGAAELGFPGLGAYAVERLGRRRRWAEDTAALAERLACLPQTRAAVFVGDLSWSMAEVLARTANPETEAQLLELARGRTVRAMKAALVGWRAGADVAPIEEREPQLDEAEDDRCTLQVTVDRVTAWAFEGTRRFLQAQIGLSNDETLVEALLAEGLDTLRYRHPGLRVQRRARDGADEARRAREEERRAAALAVERDLWELGDVPELAEHIAELLADYLVAPPRDPVALDAHFRRINTELQQRDLRLGEVASQLWAAHGWDAIGYESAAQYAQDRLGCSLASVKARMTLARRCAALPEVARAVDAGQLGFEAARLVARVAGRDTVGDWLARAAERTAKHLNEEVEAVECFARAEGRRDVGGPPDDDVMAEYIALERAMLDGTIADTLVNGAAAGEAGPSQMSGEPGEAGPSQMFGEPGEAGPSQVSETSGEAGPSQMSREAGPSQMFGEPGEAGPSQMSGEAGPSQMFGEPGEAGPSQMFGTSGEAGPSQMFGTSGEAGPSQMFGAGGGLSLGAGRVALRLRLTSDLLAWWRDCERTFRAAGETGDLLDFLIRAFWDVWLRRDPDRVAYQDVYERERHRCASPVCTNRDLTPHHLKFRSRGGGEECANLVGLCVRCHLALVHGGRMKAEPPADDIRWTLGRTPFLTIQGRTLLADADTDGLCRTRTLS